MTKHIEFVRTKIIPPSPPAALTEIGAQVDFEGIVRRTEKDQAITALFYEAYEPMARSRLTQILDELTGIHPCGAVWFIHRLDWVPVGETSLFIRVLARHRGEAFQMASQLIDRLKTDVPIWKSGTR